MADPQELPPPPRAAQMHERDERLLANIGIPAAIFIAVGAAGLGGIFTGWPHVGGAFALFGFGGALIMRLHLVKTAPAPAPKSITPFWRWYLTAIALLTWAFLGWQSWMWFHPSTQIIQGYTQTQYDDGKAATAKPLQDKLDKANQDNDALRQNVKQLMDALAKATVQPQAKSDVPVPVEKLPTSLKVYLKGSDFDVSEPRNVLVTTSFIQYRQRQGVLTTQAYPGLAILVLFKKPIVYAGDHIDDDHSTQIPTPEVTVKNPYFAVLSFDCVCYSGLLDISFK